MKMLPLLFIGCLTLGPVSSAQNSSTAKAAALEFSKPKTIESLSASPIVVGRFDCSGDGSIYTFIDGYVLNKEASDDRLALLAIHPNGTVTNFSWRLVPGFSNISLPESIFVSDSNVYVLVHGEKVGGQRPESRYPLVLSFDMQGTLMNALPLRREISPSVLGVFRSGNILLISEDRLNHRMALELVGTDGSAIRDLRLNESDFLVQAAQMPAADRGPSSYSTSLLIAMSKLFPSGNNLLLVPLETSGLPIVELDEHGVLHSVVPRLPGQMVLEGFVGSDASSWTVRLGSIIESDKEGLDSHGKVLGVATRPDTRMAQLSSTDGSLLRQIDTGGVGVHPACETNGVFRLLTASKGQGSLQVVTAEVR